MMFTNRKGVCCVFSSSNTPHSLPCHLKANVALVVAKHHKVEHAAVSAAGQTGADTGPGPDAGLQERGFNALDHVPGFPLCPRGFQKNRFMAQSKIVSSPRRPGRPFRLNPWNIKGFSVEPPGWVLDKTLRI